MENVVLICVIIGAILIQENNGATVASSTTQQDPKCVTRWSKMSLSDDDAIAEVSCNDNEVMTSCNSVLPNGGPGTRDGEYIKSDSTGKPVCVAQNGHEGNGVRASARCCKWANMQCYYEMGDKSDCTDDSRSTATCDRQIGGLDPYVTGCMTYTNWREIDGTMPDGPDQVTDLSSFNTMKCISQNGFGGAGVWAYAACCSAPDLDCKEKWSSPSGGDKGDEALVWCDAGWTMTGCMSFTFWKFNDGAYIDHFLMEQDKDQDTCKALNGGNDNSVWAIAICCKEKVT